MFSFSNAGFFCLYRCFNLQVLQQFIYRIDFISCSTTYSSCHRQSSMNSLDKAPRMMLKRSGLRVLFRDRNSSGCVAWMWYNFFHGGSPTYYLLVLLNDKCSCYPVKSNTFTLFICNKVIYHWQN